MSNGGRFVTIKQAFDREGKVTALVVDQKGDYLIETRPHNQWGEAFMDAVRLAKAFGYQVARFSDGVKS